MILVNNPGSWTYVFKPLLHSPWHGCTFADLIFPMFIFLVGFSIVLSLTKEKFNSNKQFVFKKIFFRSIKLFALGLFLNAFPFFDLNELRIMGVLQRIALVFLFSSVLFLYLKETQLTIITFAILVFYYLSMLYIPFPGKSSDPLSTQNLASHLDNFFLKGHMWKYSKTWDPEGIFSTLPAISSCLLGVLTGIFYQKNKLLPNKFLFSIFKFGAVLYIFGLIWSYYFPLNKNLWTSSFVLYSSGICILTLCLFYFLIDIKRLNLLNNIFIPFGSNAIFAYFLSEITSSLSYHIKIGNIHLRNWIFLNCFKSWLPAFYASFMVGIMWVILCFLPIYILYRKKIYIKV